MHVNAFSYQYNILHLKYLQVMSINSPQVKLQLPSEVNAFTSKILKSESLLFNHQHSCPTHSIFIVANPSCSHHDLWSFYFITVHQEELLPTIPLGPLAKSFQYHDSLTHFIWPSLSLNLVNCQFPFLLNIYYSWDNKELRNVFKCICSNHD